MAGGADKISIYRLQDTDWPEAYGLLRRDGTTRPAYVAYQVAAQYLSRISSANVARQGDVEQVIMRRPGERVSVVWNRTPKALKASIGAMSPSATLVSQTGATTAIRTEGGQFKVDLPPAANACRRERDHVVLAARLDDAVKRAANVVADARPLMRQGRDVYDDPHFGGT